MFKLVSVGTAAVLQDLTSDDMRALEEIAQERPCERGERLIGRGEVASHLAIVKDGSFALTVMFTVAGRRIESIIETKTTGDAFGWSAALPPRKSIYSVYCVWPGTLIQFHRDELQELMRLNTPLGYRFMRNVTALVGRRATVLQNLWLEEVERSPSRVKHWMQRQVEF